MKIYTKTGDDGTTGLFGAGRIAKDHVRIEAYGTVDELNSAIGICTANAALKDLLPLQQILDRIQHELFVVGGDLATPQETAYPVPRIQEAHIAQLESEIDVLDADLPPLKNFILPAGHPLAAQLHLCRTITRRAERICVTLHRLEPLSSPTVQYLNRLSDFLFTAARWVNIQTKTEEVAWKNS